MKKTMFPTADESWMTTPQLALQPLTEDMIQQEKTQLNALLCFTPQTSKRRVKVAKVINKPYLH